MKMRYFLFLAGCVSFLIGHAWARPVDLSAPSAQVGSADINGDVQLIREIDGVGLDMGPGSYLPLRYKFSTAANTGGMLGPNFSCPMFEAKNILIREQMMRAFLPCGKGLYLRRDNTDATKFQTVDQEWTGLLAGDDFTLWRDDGWKLTYRKGRLTSLQTDNNHTFTWSYSDSAMATGVSEDGQSRIGVETDPQGQLGAFTCDGKRYTVDFADRPSIEVANGQTVVGKLVSSLSAFHYPDGRTESFKVLLTPQLVPTLDFTDADKKETDYTWDAATGHIAGEKGPGGSWTYQVGEVDQPYGTPPISRTNDKNQTEGMALDGKGTYTATTLDGSTVVTHVFDSPGPLYGKVRKVEKIVDGNSTTTYQASYDEVGRLIRSVDKDGFVDSLSYDQLGRIIEDTTKLTDNPEFLKSLHEQEFHLLSLISSATSVQLKDSRIADLALFYIGNERAPNKALALISRINERAIQYKVSVLAANGDNAMNYKQKIEHYNLLERQFPERTAELNQLIQQSQMMVNAGLIK